MYFVLSMASRTAWIHKAVLSFLVTRAVLTAAKRVQDRRSTKPLCADESGDVVVIWLPWSCIICFSSGTFCSPAPSVCNQEDLYGFDLLLDGFCGLDFVLHGFAVHYSGCMSTTS